MAQDRQIRGKEAVLKQARPNNRQPLDKETRLEYAQ